MKNYKKLYLELIEEFVDQVKENKHLRNSFNQAQKELQETNKLLDEQNCKRCGI